MSKQAFSKAIDDFFAAQPCENAGDAATALLLLYDVIEEHAISAESQEQGSKEFSESLVMVQQAICWTPLRYFLDDLAQDTHLAIRAGAKGEISDQRPGAFWNDPEVGLVAAANLSIMFSARTGVSILACKQALEEANGDQEKAIEILRKRGIAQAVKKADREQSEGGIFISTDGEKAAIVTLKCETDFVARNDAFIALGQELADAFLKKGDAAAKTLAEQKMPEAIQKLGENISLGSMEEVISHSVATYVHSNRKIGVVVGSSSAEATVRESSIQ
jgi:hypothetical protein